MVKASLVLFILISALGCFCFAQEPEVTNPGTEQPEAKSVVRGRVIYEGTGQPVRRGMIGLLDAGQYLRTSVGKTSFVNGTMHTGGGFVLTDDNGEFEVRNVKAGTYYPFVKVRNVLNPQSLNSYYGNSSSISAGKLDSLFKKIVVDGVSDVNVLIPVKKGAAISGRISYADGSPAIGVEVKIVRKGTEVGEDLHAAVTNAETDDRGHYRLTELIPGTYFVDVKEPSDHGSRNEGSEDWRDFTRQTELKTYFPGVTDRKRAEAIDLDWGQEAANTDIVIPDRKLFRVSGVVIGKDTQKPLSKVKVRFERFSDEGEADYYGWNSASEVISDAAGAWAFKDLPAGKYRLRISPRKYDYYFDTKNRADESPYAEIVRELEILESDVKGLMVELPLESAVSGTIKMADKKGLPTVVRFFLIDSKRKVIVTKAFSTEQSKEEGEKARKPEIDFRIGLLSAGSYVINAQVEGEKHYVKNITLKGKDLTNRAFDIKESEQITDVKVVIADDSGTLTGSVFASKDVPAKFAIVQLIPTDPDKQKGNNFYFSGWSNSLGEFQIKAAPGEYFVIARSRKEDPKTSEEDWLKQVSRDAEKVKIKPKEEARISLMVSDR